MGKVLRHLERGLHVAKAGGEDDLVPGGSQIADHTFCIRALGYVLDKRGFDLAAQSRFDSLAPSSCWRVQPASVMGET